MPDQANPGTADSNELIGVFRRVLQLEQRRGYTNDAVRGGLNLFLANWTQRWDDSSRGGVERLIASFADYSVAGPGARRQVVEAALQATLSPSFASELAFTQPVARVMASPASPEGTPATRVSDDARPKLPPSSRSRPSRSRRMVGRHGRSNGLRRPTVQVGVPPRPLTISTRRSNRCAGSVRPTPSALQGLACPRCATYSTTFRAAISITGPRG